MFPVVQEVPVERRSTLVLGFLTNVANVSACCRVSGLIAGVNKMQKSTGGVLSERLLTVSEVASAMRVSNMTVYRLIKGGHLTAIRVGKNYRIREQEIERYLTARVV